MGWTRNALQVIECMKNIFRSLAGTSSDTPIFVGCSDTGWYGVG